MFREEYKKLIEEKYNKRFNKYKRFNRNKFNKFKELFGSFELDKMQDFYTFTYIILENDINLKDYIEFVSIIKDIIKENIIVGENLEKKYIDRINEKINKNIQFCPKCNSVINIHEIKLPKGKGNLKGWKSHLVCTNNNCLYEKFSHKTVEEIYKINEKDKINEKVSDIIDPDMNNLFGININDNIKRENK